MYLRGCEVAGRELTDLQEGEEKLKENGAVHLENAGVWRYLKV